MFEPNEENDVKVDGLIALFREHERGDVVSHGAITRVIEIDRWRQRDEYYKVVRRTRNRLRDEDGIWSRPETSVGFRLLTEQETLVDEPRMRARRARRQINLGQRAAIKLDEDKLTPLQRRLRDAVIADAAEKKRMLASREEQAARAARTHQGLPLREWPTEAS